MPFCGHAVMEALANERTRVEDPFLELFQAQQPGEQFCGFQRRLIDEMAGVFGLT